MNGPKTYRDMDLSFAPLEVQNSLKNDLRWQLCIDLALQSKGKNQRYGAVVEKDGKIIGRGWNRLLKKGEPFPFKTTFFLHAERAAIGEAIFSLECEGDDAVSKSELKGARVFVAGLLVGESRPLIRRADKIDMGSCAQCASLYVKHGLSVLLRSETGWVELSGNRALNNARASAKLLKERGISKRELRQEISL